MCARSPPATVKASQEMKWEMTFACLTMKVTNGLNNVFVCMLYVGKVTALGVLCCFASLFV